MLKKTLKDIWTAKGATVYNLSNPKSDTIRGSMLQVKRDLARAKLKIFGEHNNEALVKELNSPLDKKKVLQQVFYALTPTGASYVEDIEDFKDKHKTQKGTVSIEHDSGVKDLMISYSHLYGSKIYNAYEIRKNGKVLKRTDFMADNIFFENERAHRPNKTLNKVLEYEKIQLPKGAKVAIVFSPIEPFKYNPFWRKQDIDWFKSKERWNYHEENLKLMAEIKKSPLPINEKELKTAKIKARESRLWFEDKKVFDGCQYSGPMSQDKIESSLRW